jgi:hypothetical protein
MIITALSTREYQPYVLCCVVRAVPCRAVPCRAVPCRAVPNVQKYHPMAAGTKSCQVVD